MVTIHVFQVTFDTVTKRDEKDTRWYFQMSVFFLEEFSCSRAHQVSIPVEKNFEKNSENIS